MSTEIDELKQARYRSDKTISGHNAFLRPPTGETNSVDTRGFYFVLKEPHPKVFVPFCDPHCAFCGSFPFRCLTIIVSGRIILLRIRPHETNSRAFAFRPKSCGRCIAEMLNGSFHH